MKLSLSEISTVNASFAEDVVAYAAAGFDGIGIWEMKLPEGDDANVELIRRAGLAVASCIPAVPSILQLRLPGMEGPPDPDERVAALCASMRRLAVYEPESVLVITGPLGDLDEAEARGIVVDALREIAAAASQAGVRLGLEPVHRAEREAVSFVNSIAEAVALLDEAGLDDVGIMADAFHLRDEDPEALAAIASRVTGLHVADLPAESGRTDRELPAEDGPSARLAGSLAEAGWDGFADVEIFSTPERFWSLPAGEAARRAHAAVSRL